MNWATAGWLLLGVLLGGGGIMLGLWIAIVKYFEKWW